MGGIICDEGGLRIHLADNFIEIGDQRTDGYFHSEACLKAVKWRNTMLITAMNEVNTILEIVEKILSLAGYDIELPKIPDGVIKYLPMILDLLDVALD